MPRYSVICKNGMGTQETKWCTSKRHLTFRLPPKPLSYLEKRLYLLTPPPTRPFFVWPILFRKRIVLIHIIQILCLKLLTFPRSVIVPFSITWTLKDWWSAVPLFQTISGGTIHLIGHSWKKRHNEKSDHLAGLIPNNVHNTFVFRLPKLWDHERFQKIVFAGNDR